jgi:hypothetical protein
MVVTHGGVSREPHGLRATANADAAAQGAVVGDWDQAHKIVQDEGDANSAWVHAYLHRVEGDLGNASYWYRQAGRPVANDSLDAEWERIAAALTVM